MILLKIGAFSELSMNYTWSMNPHLITFLFLLLAIALYFVGMAMPATFFLLLGGIAELVFWVRLVNGGREKPDC